MAMAANILCKEIVHKAFQASAFVSATPIAMPSKTEWKHKATINKMLSPSESAAATEWSGKWLLVPSWTYKGIQAIIDSEPLKR